MSVDPRRVYDGSEERLAGQVGALGNRQAATARGRAWQQQRLFFDIPGPFALDNGITAWPDHARDIYIPLDDGLVQVYMTVTLLQSTAWPTYLAFSMVSDDNDAWMLMMEAPGTALGASETWVTGRSELQTSGAGGTRAAAGGEAIVVPHTHNMGWTEPGWKGFEGPIFPEVNYNNSGGGTVEVSDLKVWLWVI
jgi:hypothetical protein